MAVKIIKPGKVQKFIKTCPDCGCEFEYEPEDVKTDYTVCLTSYPAQYNTYVICPCCGKHLHHGTTFDEFPTWPNKIIYTNLGATYGNWTYNCDDCPNKPDPNKLIVGDSPCSWCSKNRFTCDTKNQVEETGLGVFKAK